MKVSDTSPTMADPTTAGGGTEGLREVADLRIQSQLMAETLSECIAARARETDRADAAEAALARASAEQARVEAERDAATRVCEMAATSGGFYARHAENATKRAEAAESRVTSLTAERDGLKAALVALSRVVDEGRLKADAPAQAAFDLALKLSEAPDAP